MSHDSFRVTALSAIESVFQRINDISLAKIKSEAKKLCLSIELKKLSSDINRNQLLSLELFFSAKIHKTECPLRVIVSERGTWQKSLALFLQEKTESFHD